jgi:hypothetical protein
VCLLEHTFTPTERNLQAMANTNAYETHAPTPYDDRKPSTV